MMDGGELEEKTGGEASVSGREREMEGCTDGAMEVVCGDGGRELESMCE